MQPSSKEQIAFDRAHPELVNCDNCDGACCRAGLFMGARETEAALIINPVRWLARPANHAQVTRQRVQMVKRGPEGARFVSVNGEIEVPKHHGLIELLEDCQQLDESGRCAIYKDRPEPCRTGLDPGSAVCLGYRAVHAARLAGELG